MDSLSPYRPGKSPSLTLLGEYLAKAGLPVPAETLHLDPLPGNLNRRDYHSRKSLKVRSGEKTLCLLTLGTGLEDLWERSTAFFEACPSITCKPLFFYHESEYDIFGIEYFAGHDLETLLREKRLSPDKARKYAEKIIAALDSTLLPSTIELAAKEIDAFLELVCTLPLFTGIDQIFLRNMVFPFVREGLLALPASTRWTNGDLIPRNILVDETGQARLIDYEFASRTHLYTEDAWRWHTFSGLSPEDKSLPGLPQSLLPQPWYETFCLLRQLVLAYEVNGAQMAVPDSQPALVRLREITLAVHHGFRTSVFLSPLGQLQELRQKTAQTQQEFQASKSALEQINRTLESASKKHQQDSARLARLLSFRETRLARIERSLSWRLTKGLTSLLQRLSLAKPIKFHFHLDTPRAWIASGERLVVRGWFFPKTPLELTEVRIAIDDRVYHGIYGLERTDVGQAHPDHSHAYRAGFEVEIEIKPGAKLLVIAACDSNDRWHVVRRFDLTKPPEAIKGTYAHWLKEFDTPTSDQLDTLRNEVAALPLQPLISVIIPVYNTPEPLLEKVITSVRSQIYPRWELCIADDASSAVHVRPLLERHAKEDSRIKVTFRTSNGHIAAASNTALTLASGEYIALLDHDDELRPHALAEVVKAINQQPKLQLIYSDEDKLDAHGNRFDPYFKPDWMPDLLIGHNYLCHFSVCRADTLRAIGGWRAGFDGAQDWDLQLRIVEKAQPAQIVHIPRILYHWRAITGSTALGASEKNYIVEAARRAITEHLERTNQKVQLIHEPGNHWRAKYPLPQPAPLVSLIIPTRNGLKYLQRCVDSILEKTTYPHYEIIIVDNNSDDSATLAYLKAVVVVRANSASSDSGKTVRVLPFPHAFNYSAINNFAVREAKGEFIGLLNNDLEVITSDWLDEMVSQAARPEIGCVGPMLYFPNDSVQHAGVVVGIAGHAGHAFKGFSKGHSGYMNHAHLVKNYSAVTGACLVVKKSIYEKIGGLDEANLAISLNDVDFCLKVRASGYRNLWTPFAELYHHESASRGYEDSPEKLARFALERETFRQRWMPVISNDPAYNPNLSLETEDFAFAYPPRLAVSMYTNK